MPRDADREFAYQGHHVKGQSWVVDEPRLIRCTETDVWTLFEGRLTRITASGKSSTPVASLPIYREVLSNVFDLPNAPIEEALNATSRL